MAYLLKTGNTGASTVNRFSQGATAATQNRARLAGDQATRAAWRNVTQTSAVQNAVRAASTTQNKAVAQKNLVTFGAANTAQVPAASNTAQTRTASNTTTLTAQVPATSNTVQTRTASNTTTLQSSQLPTIVLRTVGYDQLMDYAQTSGLPTSGLIDQNLLSAYVLDQGGTLGEARALFNAIDLNGSEYLGAEEFTQAADLMAHFGQLQFDAAQSAIENESGVTFEVFERFAQEAGLNDSEAWTAFASIDRNESGGLREAEFDSWRSLFTKWLMTESLDGADQPIESPTTDPSVTEPPTTTLPDDLLNELTATSEQLTAIINQVRAAQAAGLPLNKELLDKITLDLGGIDFTDPVFVSEAYDWLDDTRSTNPQFADDISTWLQNNGAAHPQLQSIQDVVQERESQGQTLDRDVLDSLAGIDFTDTEFVKQTYDWANYVGLGNPKFSSDIQAWLVENGAVDPSPSPPPHTNANPPAQETYGNAKEALDANAVPTVAGFPIDEFSVMDLPSGTPIDEANPSRGDLTILEAAQQQLYTQYKNGVNAGSIPRDDVRAKYVDAMDAKAALQGGYELIPYYEQDRSVGDGKRAKYPEQGGGPGLGENEVGQITYELSQADAAKLLDEEAIDAQIQELWNDATIQDDFSNAAQELIDGLGDATRQSVVQELRDAMYSPEYLYALEDMVASGLQEEAVLLTASNLSNLAVFDPELAQQTQINLAASTIASELNALLLDPSKLDIVDIELATQDATENTIQALRTGTSLIRHGSQVVNDYVNYVEGYLGDKTNVNVLSSVYKQLMIDAINGNSIDLKSVELGNVTRAQFLAAMERAYIPADLRPGLMGFMTEAQRIGVWGSMSGAAMLASFGYKVAHGAFTDDSDPIERFSAARDLISFASVIGHVAKSTAALSDTVLTLWGRNNAAGNATYQALGLQYTVPELYGRTSLVPSGVDWGAVYGSLWRVRDESWRTAGTSDGSVSGASQQGLFDAFIDDASCVGADPSVAPRPAQVNVFEGMLKEEVPPGSSAKIAGTVLKVVGNVTDLVGVADIVIGGIMAKQAMDEGDKPFAAAYSLQAISGGFVAASGMLGTAGMVSPLSAGFALAASSLFLAGAALAVVAAAIMIGVSVHRKNEARRESTNEQSEFFRRLADEGLTQYSWDHKLRFLRLAWSVYGNDNPDQNQSYFEAQPEEYQYFLDNRARYENSPYDIDRLSSSKHVHTDLTVDARKDPNTVSDWN